MLGLSRLGNALHDAKSRADGTETSLLGPFFREKALVLAPGDTIAKHAATGEEIVIFGRVLDTDGKPVPDAAIDVWQTDAEGRYDLQAHDPSVMDMRGRFTTDAEGRYHFRTLRPLGYLIPMDGPAGRLVKLQGRHGYRPAHIHVMIAAEGHRELITALYFANDAHVDSDTVFGVSASLGVSPGRDLPGIPYDFRLSRLSEADRASGRVGADPSKILAGAV